MGNKSMNSFLGKGLAMGGVGACVLLLAGCGNPSGMTGTAPQVTEAATPADPLLDGLLFHAAFEDTLKPSFAQGSDAATCDESSFVDGVVGKAVEVGGDGYSFHPSDNFSYGRGTVSFWVNPAWQGSDPLPSGARGLFTAVNFVLCYEPPPGKARFFFMTGTTKAPEGFVWDYGVASDNPHDWKAGEWHHVLATWDAETGAKSLYFDGELASAGVTPWIRPGSFLPGEKIFLGAKNGPGTYDELMIWDRVLTGEEIALLARKPADTSAILSAAPPVAKPAKISWPITFAIKQISPPVAAIVAPGETFRAVVPAENPSDAAFAGQAQFTLIDFWGKARETKELDVTLGPKEKQELTIPFTIPERGSYKISVSLDVDGRRFERDVTSLGCWPTPSAPPDPESFFGNHVNSWGNGAYLDQAQRLGQGWMRNHNMLQATWWMSVQPEPGEFKWEEADAVIDDHARRGMKVLGQLFSTPYWAVRGGPVEKFTGYPKPLVPDDELWRTYVYETVRHFKDRIKHWEIQNEPEVSMFWGGSPEEFAEVCRIAYEAAKKADPDCVVMVGGFTSPAWRWHEAAAKAGAFKSCDVISLHYGCPLEPPEQTAEELHSVLEHFQALAVKHGPGKRLPIWNTEGGTPDTTWLNGLDYEGLPKTKPATHESWRIGAIRTVQVEAIMQAMGIVKHFIYFQNRVSPGPNAADGTLMLDVTLAPSPKLMARVAFAAQVDGTLCVGEVRRPEGRFWAILYERKDGKGSVALCWVGDQGEATLAPGDAAGTTRRVDLMGNEHAPSMPITVTDEPIFIHSTISAGALKDVLEKAKITVVKEPTKLAVLAAGEEKPAVPVLPNFAAPMENPTGLFQIDIKPFCTMGFADEKAGDGIGGWADEGPLNDMRDMPTGRQTFYGVPFDIIDPAANNGKSVITLKGITTQTLPEKVVITVPPRKCRALYFLHSAGWGSPGEIGTYVVRYADGSSVAIPINIVENCNNWWFGHDPEEISRPVPVRVTNTSTGKPAWRYPRVFEWQNPKMDQPIVGIDFLSKGGPQVPILIAITGV
jgi:hypothetical protein